MEHSLDNLVCPRDNHFSNKIFAYCIDPDCNEKNKFVCNECVFDIHSRHKLVRIKELNFIVQNKYSRYEKYVEEAKETLKKFKRNQQMQFRKLEGLKEDIIKNLDEKIYRFKEELENKYQMINSENDKKYDNIKEFEKYFTSVNADATQTFDLTKLTEICNNIYQEKEEEKIENSSNFKESGLPSTPEKEKNKIDNKNKYILGVINKNLDSFFDIQYELMTKFINDIFLKMSEDIFKDFKFEWCNKTFSNYGFLYEITDDNTKGTKTKLNGTMTILRAKEQIKRNFKYLIKFKIGLKSGSDFNIGIGTDNGAKLDWLKTAESICLSDQGIFNLGKCIDTSNKIKNNDIVEIEINNIDGNKYFKGFINNKLVCKIDYNLENIYIMAAIRNVGNFIEVLNYEVSPC